MHVQSTSSVRVWVLRSKVLSLLKTCSIGLKSGLYGGRYCSAAPAPSMAALTPATLSERPRVGVMQVVAHASIQDDIAALHRQAMRDLVVPCFAELHCRVFQPIRPSYLVLTTLSRATSYDKIRPDQTKRFNLYKVWSQGVDTAQNNHFT